MKCEAYADTDWLQYIASYGDLILAFGPDPAAGAQHYFQYGQAEGRVLDKFDELQYLANYSDLRQAFGNDTHAATIAAMASQRMITRPPPLPIGRLGAPRPHRARGR